MSSTSRDDLVEPPLDTVASGPQTPSTDPDADQHSAPWWLPIAVLVVVVAVAYGYEVFALHVSLDEPVAAMIGNTQAARIALGQGRWAMALVTVLAPEPVVPAIPVAVGVALATWALWSFVRGLGYSRWISCAAVGLAITVPTWAATFSFSVIAVGIGVGVLATVWFSRLAQRPGWPSWLAAVAVGALAVGCYDPFAVALVVVAAGVTAVRGDWATLGRGLAGAGAAYLVSRVVGIVVRAVLQVPSSAYPDSYLRLDELRQHPIQVAVDAVGDHVKLLWLSTGVVNGHSPWLALFWVVALATAFVVALRQPRAALVCVSLLVVVGTPVAIGLVAAVPLRSTVYFGFVALVVAAQFLGVAHRLGAGRAGVRRVAAALVVLAIWATSTSLNAGFAAGEAALVRDRHIALRIEEEAARLTDGRSMTQAYPVVVHSTRGLPTSLAWPRHEALGLSVLMVEPWMAAFYLRTQGVLVAQPGDEQLRIAARVAPTQPSYPAPGWCVVSDGVIVVNLG